MDTLGKPIPGAGLYLTLEPGAVGHLASDDTAVGSKPVFLTTQADGSLPVTYGSPDQLPNVTTTDVLIATSDAAGDPPAAKDTYTYVTPVPALSPPDATTAGLTPVIAAPRHALGPAASSPAVVVVPDLGYSGATVQVVGTGYCTSCGPATVRLVDTNVSGKTRIITTTAKVASDGTIDIGWQVTVGADQYTVRVTQPNGSNTLSASNGLLVVPGGNDTD